MTNKKMLTLSIVIPAYNEEDYLAACLESISDQTKAPLEVIVVDNNSTDRTAHIARLYPFVKVVSEKRQHQAFAQKTGFDKAHGDIIGRIDADTILPPDWVEKVSAYFVSHRRSVALTGGFEPYDLFFKRSAKMMMRLYHRTIPRLITGHLMLWGSNAAIRAQAWRNISSQVLQRDDIWEDYDLSFLLAKLGSIDWANGIEVKASFRTAHKPLLWLVAYQFRSIRTFSLRSSKWQTIIYSILHLSLLISFPPAYYSEKLINAASRLSHRFIELTQES